LSNGTISPPFTETCTTVPAGELTRSRHALPLELKSNAQAANQRIEIRPRLSLGIKNCAVA
jgi:hypothetical protein